MIKSWLNYFYFFTESNLFNFLEAVVTKGRRIVTSQITTSSGKVHLLMNASSIERLSVTTTLVISSLSIVFEIAATHSIFETFSCFLQLLLGSSKITAQNLKFSIKDVFSICDKIRSFLRIWVHLLKKFFMRNFMFFAVDPTLLNLPLVVMDWCALDLDRVHSFCYCR